MLLIKMTSTNDDNRDKKRCHLQTIPSLLITCTYPLTVRIHVIELQQTQKPNAFHRFRHEWKTSREKENAAGNPTGYFESILMENVWKRPTSSRNAQSGQQFWWYQNRDFPQVDFEWCSTCVVEKANAYEKPPHSTASFTATLRSSVLYRRGGIFSK